MMTTISTKTLTTTMTLWKNDMPIGICMVDVQGKLVVHANDSSKQRNLRQLIRSKYRIQAGLAKQEQRPFDLTLFLEGLPRYMRSTTMYASAAEDVDLAEDPQYHILEQYAQANTKRSPRPRVRRV